MDWYYTRNGEQAGPVSDEELSRLVTDGVVKPESLVWHSGMAEWKSYREAAVGVFMPAAAASSAANEPIHAGGSFCSECGNNFSRDDLMQYGQSSVCANCKGPFLQRLREGVPMTAGIRYAGFWIRFLAIVIDGLILGTVDFAVNLIFRFSAGNPLDIREPLGIGGGHFFFNFGLPGLINIAIGIAYQVYFLTKFAATPGKLALGLKVVMAAGGPITTGVAVARYFCYWLDWITLAIGFIIAGFDSEKRALHDYICGTRVIQAK